MKKWLLGLVCVGMWATAAVGDLSSPATLPVEWAGETGFTTAAIDALTGWDATGLTTPYATSTKFDGAGDKIVIYFDGAPGEIVYTARRSDAAALAGAYEATIQESADNASWSTVRTFDGSELNGTLASFTNMLSSSTRYVKFEYVTKPTGQNFGVGYVKISTDGPAVFGVSFDQADGFPVGEGAGAAITATAENGTDPITYVWTSTLDPTHYQTNVPNIFFIGLTAPMGTYTSTVVATDAALLSATSSISFTVIAVHPISITPPENGTVTTVPESGAAAGGTVTITATPAEGYQVASVQVVDEESNPVGVAGSPPTYTFSMPDSAVTVTVAFEVFEGSGLIISEVADPSGTGGDRGRFVELYNTGAAAIDLAAGQWYLAKQVNGGATWDNVALTGTVGAAETYVVAAYADFLTLYPLAPAPNQTSGNVNGSGDDGYFLYSGGNNAAGTLEDAYGVINEDGTGMPWEYTDSRAARNAGVTAGNPTWTASEWTITDPAVYADMTPGVHPDGSAVFGVSLDRANGFTVEQGSSAAIVATAANGTPEYGYSWSTTVAEGQYTAVGDTFTILATAPAGGYSATVTATDSSDPVQTAEKTVTFSVAAPYAITITPPVDGTVTTTPADEAIAGAPVTITATPVDGNHRVASIAVVDAASNPVTVTGNAFVMPASAVTVTVLFEAYDAPDARIDFEDYAGSYARNEYVAGGVTWTMTNAFAGATADDSKNGAKSGRFENNRGGAGNPAKMTSTAFAEPVTKINFFYANYGVNDGGGFKVQVSANGADWTDVGAAEYNPASKTLVEGVIDTLPADMTYVQFITTAGTAQRVNIDDIGIYFGAATPTLSYTGATTIQLGESFALVFTLNGATASGWQYLLEGSGREDLDNGSVNTFNFTPTFAGTYYLTMTALDEAVNPIATREVVLTVESGLPPADIGAITFLPASGDFTFELPAGYTTPVAVYGADAEVGPLGNWDFSILTEGVHYTRDGATVTILTAPQSRQIIRIGVSSNPD